MFDTLIASPARGSHRRLVPSGAIALFTHLTLGAAAVWVTLRPQPVVGAATASPIVVWPRGAEQRSAPGPAALVTRPVGPLGDVPVAPPLDLPPLEPGPAPDLGLWVRVEQGAGAGGANAATDPSGPWSPCAVEEQPALFSGPPPAYPEPLRRAGIGGRVVVEAVIDAVGRAEPGSVRVVASPDHGFDAAARSYVLHALFRPARVHGRAVRVLVRVPIDFTLARDR